jgi:hypothetical protein
VHHCAAYEDEAALARFAEGKACITCEFENVSVEAMRFLANQVAVRPAPRVWEIFQDRLLEKQYLRSVGIPTVPFAPVDPQRPTEALEQVGCPCVVKTRRFGLRRQRAASGANTRGLSDRCGAACPPCTACRGVCPLRTRAVHSRRALAFRRDGGLSPRGESSSGGHSASLAGACTRRHGFAATHRYYLHHTAARIAGLCGRDGAGAVSGG